MTKKSSVFLDKKVTPSVAAPGDTNPSDVTGRKLSSHLGLETSKREKASLESNFGNGNIWLKVNLESHWTGYTESDLQ